MVIPRGYILVAMVTCCIVSVVTCIVAMVTGGKAPQDRTIVVDVLRTVTPGLFVIMCCYILYCYHGYRR